MSATDIFKILFLDFKPITIPLLNIIAVMVIKAVSFPGKIEGDTIKELFNFGGSLRNSGLMYMVTSICYQSQQALIQPAQIAGVKDMVLIQNCMILIYTLTMLIFSLIFRNSAYDKTDKMTVKGIAFSDIVGIGMLLLAIWLIG